MEKNPNFSPYLHIPRTSSHKEAELQALSHPLSLWEEEHCLLVTAPYLHFLFLVSVMRSGLGGPT